MIITVTPNPAIDRTLEVSALRLGEVNRSASRQVEPSGKGVNVTRALLRNGIRSTAVLPLGGPEGSQLAGLLDDEDVPYVALPITGPVRVNISVRSPGGIVTKINEPGPTLTWADAETLADGVLGVVGRGDWVVGSGALPGGVAADFYAELVTRVRQAGARFALDSSGEALRRGLEAWPDLVKPNRDELAELVGTPLRTLGEVIAAAETVRERAGGVVLVSLGTDGGVLVDGDGPVLHAELAVGTVRSSVGAGDNFLAGYLSTAAQARVDRRDSAGRAGALREAVAWGSVAVRSEGSLGRRVGDADRRSVRMHTAPDPDRRLS
ncbi:1-phosphofructokinase family hexose kinase [Actinopolymorpha sp. B11F2]|uniref:1-phosphofructokinase family hexose kinase n=1 Tax=Actinopolymorpha sp. B11F2 TaxID=3160862 RepID=UPI0032E3A719